MPNVPRRFLPQRWVRRTLPAAVAVALVIAGTLVTRANANANTSPADTYRTATVTFGSVEQRLNLTGSVQRVNQASQKFAIDGTTASVPVSVGDTVTAGQTLATLDPAPLRSAVTAAQASLAKAKATLESDQSPTTSPTAAARTTPVTTSPSLASPSGRSGAGTSQSLARAQKRVTGAQKAVTADLGRMSATIAGCMPFFPSASSPAGTTPTRSATTPTTSSPASTSPPSTGGRTPGPAPTATTSARPSARPSAGPSAGPSAAAIVTCLGALRIAPTQRQLQRDQQELTLSQANLVTAITLAITRAGATSSSGTDHTAASAQPSETPTSTNQSSRGSTEGGLSSTSRVVSDEGAVTQAEEKLSSAQHNLSSATLKSSIAGRVGSVSLVTGASSRSKTVVIVGTGAVGVTINVPQASMAATHVGQKATVTPQGAASSVPGAVTSISLLPSTSGSTSGSNSGSTSGSTSGATAQGAGTAQASATSSSPVYPVVVLVNNALPTLASGSRAEVSLLVGTAANVLTVPNSALTPLGNGQALALTLKGAATTRALVNTGYVGTLTTQITTGLTAGRQVVLADLSTALPTNTTSSRRFGVGGGAGFGGGGLGGAGLGGRTATGGTGSSSPR